jgi:hypothetical protein
MKNIHIQSFVKINKLKNYEKNKKWIMIHWNGFLKINKLFDTNVLNLFRYYGKSLKNYRAL